MTSCLLSCTPSPSKKGSTLKKVREGGGWGGAVSGEANYFLFTVNPISERRQKHILSLKVFLFSWTFTNWWYFFLIFPSKPDTTFHAICLQWRKFAWNGKPCFFCCCFFLEKIRKKKSMSLILLCLLLVCLYPKKFCHGTGRIILPDCMCGDSKLLANYSPPPPPPLSLSLFDLNRKISVEELLQG